MADISIQDRKEIEALEESDVFKGLTMSIHGSLQGVTASVLKRIIKKHGGKTSDQIRGNADVSHIVLSGGLCKSSHDLSLSPFFAKTF